ncbi:MAG: flagellar hook-basal body complex protein [Peptococcaceae bacterium]|nr:flagellar hook-basal body complex protein [Peptococcaceae bacterium]
MHISSAYLKSLQTKLDLIGNNIANVNTRGFKEQLRSFEESYDFQDRSLNNALYGRPVVLGGTGTLGPLYTGMRMNMNPGATEDTGSTLDVAISGDGFFQVRLANGELAYTRVGHFTIDQNRNLVTFTGMLFEPAVTAPVGATNVVIGPDGTITADVNTQGVIDQGVVLGQVQLARFANEQALQQIGGGLFLPTAQSGVMTLQRPGTEGIGSLVSGRLEMSNVDLTGNMVDMIAVQRAYQTKSRSIRTQDEMLQTAVTMRGQGG